MKVVRDGALERTSYDALDHETQKFFRYLLMLEIKRARYAVEQLEGFSGLEEMKLSRKREAINCWKFLEMIK